MKTAKLMMAATELDPLFLKALKLLHSRSKDAASQLKQMYYDVVAKKRSNWNGKKVSWSQRPTWGDNGR